MAEERKSSTTIGCAWFKMSEKGNEYYPIAVNKELLPLTITEKHSLTLFPVSEEDRKSKESPNFRLVLSTREKKQCQED